MLNFYQSLEPETLYNLLDSLREEDFILLESTRVTRENRRSMLFRNPTERLTFIGGRDEPGRFMDLAGKKLDQGYYLAGWLAYEFGYLLEPRLKKLAGCTEGRLMADFGVFTKPAVYDHYTGAWKNDGSSPPEINARKFNISGSSYSIDRIRPSQTREKYIRDVKSIKDYIAGGDTYQVNYTLKLLFDFTGSPEELYITLRRNQSVSYGAFIRNNGTLIMSFSPELFFHKQGNICTVRPMKGTIRRGRSFQEDHRVKNFLKEDTKNRSENIMIVDMLRNDLGRISVPGAVHVPSLFDVETYESLHQMTTTVRTSLRENLRLHELFQGLFPCGSVTGAPKIRTMEIINELEEMPRGVYTGAIGFLSPDGEAGFNVPIRTLTLKDGKGEMGIGSGIIHDSDPKREWEECLLKAQFLTSPREEFQLIETILWQPDSGYWLLERHLNRLAESAAYFEFPFDRQAVTDLLKEEARNLTDGSWKVRLLLDRNGRKETSRSPLDQSTTSTALPKIILAKEHVDSRQPTLFHKTTSRTLYNRIYREVLERGFFDALFTNEKGELTEGAISNLFIRQEGAYYTPPVECGLLPGVFRQYFLDTCSKAFEKVLTPPDLFRADAVYLANSVRGMVEVAVHPPQHHVY